MALPVSYTRLQRVKFASEYRSELRIAIGEKALPSLELRDDLVRDRLHRRLGLGIITGSGVGFRRDCASHARAPFVVVAQLAFLESVARPPDLRARAP